MRIALVGVLLVLSSCRAIFRAMNGRPSPDDSAISAFLDEIHCPKRHGSTENVERDGRDYLRVQGCGEERDCRFMDADNELRMTCILTQRGEAMRAAAEEEARKTRALDTFRRQRECAGATVVEETGSDGFLVA